MVKRFLKNELAGWKAWEAGWLITACVIITILSIYWGDSLMGIISATTGVACVVCTGKGKLSAYIFGLVNSVLYALIAYNSKLYGETMLNLIYYVPMQFYGFYVWNKNMNAETNEVKKRHMTNKTRLIFLGMTILGTVLYGILLHRLGDAMPYIDAFTTVSSVIAMIISVKMYAEQWWLWIGVDIFTVFMWAMDYVRGNTNFATLLMWIVYLGNAVIMCCKWEKEVKENRALENK